MQFSPLIMQLIEAFKILPGVGPKTAQRLAFFLLERNPAGGQHLALKLQESLGQIGRCESCRILTELKVCGLCDDKRRNPKLLCVVQNPADVLAIEQSGHYRGYYFVLTGHLSPIDGLGPEEIGIPELHTRLQQDGLEEIVLATNATVEGEATAFYVAEICKKLGIPASRIAQGIPLGGELEYVDGNTLARAIIERKSI